MSPVHDEEGEIGNSLPNDAILLRQERIPWYRRLTRKVEVHHVVGSFFICVFLLVLVFAKPLFGAKQPASLYQSIAADDTKLDKRVDKGTVRLAMLGSIALGGSQIGSAIGAKSVGQGVVGALIGIFSGIVIKWSGSSAATVFFGYTKRDVRTDPLGAFSINGVFPHETQAWEYLHTVKDVKHPWTHHLSGATGWVKFHQDKTSTWGSGFNYTLTDDDLAKRESGGCEVLGTCPQSQGEVIVNLTSGDDAGESDEEWDQDDWQQLAESWVSQLQSAGQDDGTFEIDNPAGVALSGSFEVDSA